MSSDFHDESNQSDAICVQAAGREVTRLLLDYRFTLEMWTREDTLQITLAQKFEYVRDGITYLINPDEKSGICRVLFVLYQMIDSVTATSNGRLTIVFRNGDRIVSEPHDQYEAWDIGNLRGLRLIALPGGGLAKWSENN